MSIEADVLSNEAVVSLGDMFAADYANAVPSMFIAIGACGGFAAQIAVWYELVLPQGRNPGDFLVCATTKSGETLVLGEAINQFLFARDRLSFLSLPSATLANASQLFDIGELVRHVAGSIGSDQFGRPRVPPSIGLLELPRAALDRNWGTITSQLQNYRTGEWPTLLGAVAHNAINAHRDVMTPAVAVKLLFEAAVPISKINPATVEYSGVTLPPPTDWSMRALRPEHQNEVLAEIRAAMPAMPAAIHARPLVLPQPSIAFLNLSGARYEALAAKDKDDIGSLFGDRIKAPAASIPRCDVLFLYCDVEPSGKVAGERLPLRDLIDQSGARIAVVEIPGDVIMAPAFQQHLTQGQHPPVNLVVVGNRNGDAFPRFFRSLFQMMLNGTTMPMAWVELAPQGPQQKTDIPGMICLMEAGQIAFAKPLTATR